MIRAAFTRLRGLSISLKFIIGCSFALATALVISFYVISQRQERLIMEQVEKEARVLFTQIVITRSWIADHGGILLEKRPWMKPSPYLEESEIVDSKGRRYIRKTPAMVTKDLSRYSKEKGLYWFHITSLKLTNPENAPDLFEKTALEHFEKDGVKEFISIERVDGARYLRYISPLFVEEACLKCHARQGYTVGNVRGAISIVIPVDKTLAAISSNKKSMFVAALLSVLTLMAAIFLMMRSLVLTPMKKLKSSITEFSEDKSPTVEILKTGDEFEDLSRAFTDMALSLSQYHTSLNDRIWAATKDLEETNRKLKEANRLLSETNLKKSDFIAGASHEIRTPLTAIKGAMDYISTRLSSRPSHPIQETSLDDLHIFFEVIKKNAERLIRMVNDMLDIERIETGSPELQFTDTDLSYIISEIVTYFQAHADEKAIELRADIADDLLVYVDEDRIRQVLINLFSNAIKFCPEGTVVSITAFRKGDVITTKICDEGPGIPPAEQEKVFEKFYKKGNKEGSGLGLAICKSIVEAHGGVIGVESDGRQGSCFYFSLPHQRNP